MEEVHSSRPACFLLLSYFSVGSVARPSSLYISRRAGKRPLYVPSRASLVSWRPAPLPFAARMFSALQPPTRRSLLWRSPCWTWAQRLCPLRLRFSLAFTFRFCFLHMLVAWGFCFPPSLSSSFLSSPSAFFVPLSLTSSPAPFAPPF